VNSAKEKLKLKLEIVLKTFKAINAGMHADIHTYILFKLKILTLKI
jgi:hypothetical protein